MRSQKSSAWRLLQKPAVARECSLSACRLSGPVPKLGERLVPGRCDLMIINGHANLESSNGYFTDTHGGR